jgi:hypothetical protein
MDFMSGKIPFHSPNTGEKFWYIKSPKMGARGKICPTAMRNKFDMIQIQAVEYDGISDSIQRDIFREFPCFYLTTMEMQALTVQSEYKWELPSQLRRNFKLSPGSLRTG